ncbi:hypothetical protein BKM15_13735 [Pseudomonas syringae pv. syringae]|nr:hypothetical protein BKM15_13735 [Pseudomonas syringae pv. syringae]
MIAAARCRQQAGNRVLRWALSVPTTRPMFYRPTQQSPPRQAFLQPLSARSEVSVLPFLLVLVWMAQTLVEKQE